jgi:hypothetical protein
MEILTLSIIGVTVVVSLSIAFSIVKLIRRKNIKIVERPVPVPVPEVENPTPPVETFTPVIKTPDEQLFSQFIKEYDNSGLSFDNVPFRPGATMTCAFGIAEGFKYFVKGTDRLWDQSMPIAKREMRWGYVRPHMGIDRAAAKPYTLKNGNVVQDPVIAPFNFNRSQIVDFGDYSFGTLISLFNDTYQFEFSIAHMHPKHDIIPWSLNRLMQQGSFDQGWLLGSAGSYGYSSGAHTHTVVKSYDDSCEVFDIILRELYGDKSLKEYTSSQIVREYRKYSAFKESSEKIMLEDWDAWKKKKKIIFANPYKIVRVDPADNRIRTWYSTYLLFNKL